MVAVKANTTPSITDTKRKVTNGPTSRICIITAALPPTLDGVGDYTARLASELSAQVQVTILAAECSSTQPVPGATVIGVFDPNDRRSVWRIAEEVSARRPNWVLLQYSPFAYGPRGLNLHLPRMIKSLRRSSPGTRVAIMAHETYVPISSWRFAVMSTWQRWQF
jgi:hypothetical protein